MRLVLLFSFIFQLTVFKQKPFTWGIIIKCHSKVQISLNKQIATILTPPYKCSSRKYICTYLICRAHILLSPHTVRKYHFTSLPWRTISASSRLSHVFFSATQKRDAFSLSLATDGTTTFVAYF